MPSLSVHLLYQSLAQQQAAKNRGDGGVTRNSKLASGGIDNRQFGHRAKNRSCYSLLFAESVADPTNTTELRSSTAPSQLFWGQLTGLS